MTKNYRSVQSILDASQKVIENNSLRISSKLNITKAQKSQIKSKDEKAILYGEFSTSYTENHYIAKEVKKLIEHNVPAHEIAVIYRNNADSVDIADMFSRMGIEYTLEGGENVLETGVIIRLLHLLKVIYKIRSKDEDLDMFTLLNYEFLKVDQLDVLKLSRFASSKKLNFFEAISHSEIAGSGIKDTKTLSDIFTKFVVWNDVASNKTFINFLEEVMNDSGYLDWVLNQPDSYELLNKVNSFLSEIKRLNYSNRSLNLETFLKYLDLMSENGLAINEQSIDVQTKSVKLTTAHKSKGLEFKYVFIPKFIDKKWGNAVNRDLIKLPPSIIKTIDLSDEKVRKHQQEEDERRLFFVVLTRAKEQITITSAKNYQSTKYQKSGVSSMFMHEIPEDYIKEVDISRHEEVASEILKQLMTKSNASEASIEEQDFLQHALRNFKLSASSLNSYLECAYKFKLEYLFRTPQQKTRSLALGSSVHSALELAYKDLKSKKAVTYKKLQRDFSEALKKEILIESELREIEEEGHVLLKIYHETYLNEFNCESSKNLLHMEKFFGWGFSKPLLDGKIHLQGKVDKIELLDKDTKEIKITDYKTGRPKSRNEILGETKYSDANQYRQLLFYKLLIDLDNTFNYKVREVELDYIGQRNTKPKRENFVISEEDLETLRETIRKVSDDIKALKFERTLNYSVCQMCRFKYHCYPDGIPVATNPQLSLDV